MLLEKLVIIAIIIAIKSLKEYRKNYYIKKFNNAKTLEEKAKYIKKI